MIALPRLALLAALLLAACAAKQNEAAPRAEAPSGAGLGTNLAGESCDGRVRADETGDPGAPPPLDIFCAGAKSPAGTLYATVLPLTMPAAGEERRQAIERAAGQTPATLEIARRMRCQPSRWVAAGEAREASLAACVLAEGNFPEIALTFASGKLLYQATAL